MGDGKIHLTKEEQIFLMEFLELEDPTEAAKKFASIMREEMADPTQIEMYIRKILKKLKA